MGNHCIGADFFHNPALSVRVIIYLLNVNFILITTIVNKNSFEVYVIFFNKNSILSTE